LTFGRAAAAVMANELTPELSPKSPGVVPPMPPSPPPRMLDVMGAPPNSEGVMAAPRPGETAEVPPKREVDVRLVPQA